MFCAQYNYRYGILKANTGHEQNFIPFLRLNNVLLCKYYTFKKVINTWYMITVCVSLCARMCIGTLNCVHVQMEKRVSGILLVSLCLFSPAILYLPTLDLGLQLYMLLEVGIWTPVCVITAWCQPLEHLSMNVCVILTVGLSWMMPSWEVRGPFSCGFRVVLHSYLTDNVFPSSPTAAFWILNIVGVVLLFLCDLVSEEFGDSDRYWTKWVIFHLVRSSHWPSYYQYSCHKKGKLMVSVTFLCVTGRTPSSICWPTTFRGTSPQGGHPLESFPPPFLVTFHVQQLYNYCCSLMGNSLKAKIDLKRKKQIHPTILPQSLYFYHLFIYYS